MKKIIIIIVSILILLGIMAAVYLLYIKAGLEVTTNLKDAKIFVNKKQVGTGKVQLQLNKGKYLIQVKREQYSNYSTEVSVWGWQNRLIEFNLKRLPEPIILEKEITTMDRYSDFDKLILAKNDGKEFIKYNPINSSFEQLSKVDFGQATSVSWPNNFFIAYIWRKDGTSGLLDLKRYNLLDQEFFLWPQGIISLVWKDDGNTVYYVYKTEAGEFSLVKSTPLNQNIERLYFHLDKEGLKKPSLQLTKNEKDMLLIDSDLFIFNLYEKSIKKITDSGQVKTAKLSRSGKYIVYSDNSATYLCNLDGSKKKKIDKPASAFEWLENGNEIISYSDQDGLRKINLQQNIITPFGHNGTIKNLSKLTILKDNGSVYYLSDNNLYKIDLQQTNIKF